jgi:type IV pilus assembly protein PilM
MEFLPRTLGTRPRLACEVRAEGIVAARAEDAAGILSAAARAPLAHDIALPQLRGGIGGQGTPVAEPVFTGTPADRAALVAATRKALEAVALKSREVTLIVPDSAVRVLLLDFDTLPGKPAEALPIVRFRLKKLLPFDADGAAVTFQVMATAKNNIRIVAVAMPLEVLTAYEAIVREAGFEPGAILPSTLAAVAGIPDGPDPLLLVNAGAQGITSAILQAGVLLLHRSVDLAPTPRPEAAHANGTSPVRLPLVDREASAEEWARQEPVVYPGIAPAASASPTALLAREDEAGSGSEADSDAGHQAIDAAHEIAQAVSVAAAYFEDTLEKSPSALFSAGPLGASALARLLHDAGIGPIPVEEIVTASMLGPGIPPAGSPGRIPPGWLAGVRGALAN